MQNLVNITTSSEKQTFIDAHSVTGIQVVPERGEMAIYTEKGILYHLEMKSWNIDVDALVQTLADAGNPLVALPLRHEGKEYPHFVNPAAVTFVTLSVPDKNGRQGLIAGVRGVGWEENYEATPAEIKTLLDAVRASGTQLIEFKPEEAHARWSRPAALYIDPASVREIRDDGGQVNVGFKASGTLDVQVHDPEYKTPINRDEERTARLALAEKIADANGTLTRISDPLRAVYVTPDEFSAVRFFTSPEAAQPYGMMLDRPKTPSNPYPEAVRVQFNTAADRDASLQTLVAAAQNTKTAKAPKPR